MLKIENGLFSGTVIPETQIVTLTDDNNLPIFKSDGSLIQYWPSFYRTPIFLEIFTPLQGWGILIETSDSKFQFPSRFPSRDGALVFQPTLYITAKLMKDGQIIAQATSLATMEGSKSLEAAESIARGRLYDALGLSFPRYQEPAPVSPSATDHVKPVPSNTVTQIKSIEPKEDAQDIKPELPEAATSNEVVVETKANSTKVGKVNGDIERNLLQQVILQCNQRGVDVPSFESNSDAKAFLLSLLKKQA